MITKLSKCPQEVRQSVAKFAYENREFSEKVFPNSANARELSKVLALAENSWYALLSDHPIALFKLDLSEPTAKASQICLNRTDSFESVLSNLREDLQKMKIANFDINISLEHAEFLATKGFENRGVLIRLSGAPTETNMMPILPLTNPNEKEIPSLSKLMYESYGKSQTAFPDVHATEKLLRNTISGAYGKYLPKASFVSGALPNLVSACLMTLTSHNEANITQLFTHPLYRARGLATTEVAAAMNRLVKDRIERLTVWTRENNDVAKRLFAKMGFKEDTKLVEMAGRI
jgi:ribosomal protein S18 acetylase RimI-like enzyme